MDSLPIRADQYASLRREFIFKVDGDRPILFPVDSRKPMILSLLPVEGLALSMLDGKRPFAAAGEIFAAFFPPGQVSSLLDLVSRVDARIRAAQASAGHTVTGVVEISDREIEHAPQYDPRQFVVSGDGYRKTMTDVKTRIRLTVPICICTVFTHKCHTNCVYCYAERRQVPELPLQRWREIIQEMADLGIVMAAPDNGDTLARSDGIELLECLIEHKMHFLLSTKCHVSNECVRRLVDAGFKDPVRGVVPREVQLSFDAVDEGLNSRILGVKKPRVELTADSLKNLLDFGIMPTIKGVITSLNVGEPRRIVDFMYPRGARRFAFVRYSRSFHRHTDDLFVRPADMAMLRDEFRRIRDRYPDIELLDKDFSGQPGESAAKKNSPSRKELWDKRSGCGGGWFTLGISADGSAYLCEQMEVREPFIVGDARTQSIMEIWNGDKLLNFIHPTREQFKDAICTTCPEFEKCMWERGRCYRDAYFSYGSIFQPPPMCPKNRRRGLPLLELPVVSE